MPFKKPIKNKGITIVNSALSESDNIDYDTGYKLSGSNLYLFKSGKWIPQHSSGYICGGSTSITTVEKIEFPFDSGIVKKINNLSTNQSDTSGCNSTNYGYIFGGNTSSVIQRITFPFESGTSTINCYLAETNGSYASGFNSSICGYTAGGNSSRIEKIVFPFNSGLAKITSFLYENLKGQSSFNSSKFGYLCNGDISGSKRSYIQRLNFSLDNANTILVGLCNYTTSYLGGCNSSVSGFTVGGYNISTSSVTEKVLFPFDSGISEIAGYLSRASYGISCVNSNGYGYFHGSYGVATTYIERFTFPFDYGSQSITIGNSVISRFSTVGIDNTDFNTIFI